MKQCNGFILVALLIFVSAGPGVVADDKNQFLDQKQELEKIRQEVERSQARLDSLRNAEASTHNQIAGYDEKIAANRKVIGRLSGQLNQVRDQIARTESQLDDSRSRLERAHRKYLGDIRHFYMSGTHRSEGVFWELPEQEIQANRQVAYLAALAAFESENVLEAGQYLSETMNRLDELASEQDKVTSLKEKREVATALDQTRKEQKEDALEKIRRRKLAEGDRMLTLKQAAEEMEAVIVRLEQERRRQLAERGEQPRGPSIFAGLKGQLQPPLQGKIVVPFGPAIDPVTRLRSFSPGITIQARAQVPVTAVAAGEIAYVGNLRGYGKFVIINHDDEYYTTYAGLEEPGVRTGDFVTSSTRLGVLNDDGQLKFELRKGREPLDPVTWIRIDSY